jgi:hypothetical protein
MAFPTSPTNGQIVVVNNISYQYSNVSNSWTRILSTANIITANTLVSNGYISAAGNISTGNYFIGNGSLLTGIATGTPTQIANGTSNVAVASSGGNIRVNVGGTSNVVVWATTGEYVTGVVSASGNVTGSNLLTGGAISATGTLSVTGTTTLGTASTGNISAGNVTTGGLISAAGNITGGNLSGTNIVGTLTTASQTNITSVGTLGSLAVAANVTGGNLLTGGLISAAGNIRGNNISAVGDVNSNNLLTAGVTSAAGNITGGNILTGGLISAVSTITGTSHLGSVVSVTANVTGGNLLTSGVVSATGNIVSANNIIASKVVTANDNIVINSTGSEGGQLVIGWVGINNIVGQANSTWNMDVDNGNVLRIFYQNAAAAAGVLMTASPTSNIVTFPQSAGVSATGNISAPYFIGNGSQLTGISAGGTPSSIVNGTSNVVVAASGNVTVGVAGTAAVATFYTAGIIANSIAATNNGNAYNFKVGDDAWLGDINTADTIGIRGQQNAANGYIVFGNADSSTKLGRAGSGPLTYDAAFSAVGNVTGGNILTGGLISATSTITGAANITGGNLLTGGLISAASTVIGTSHLGSVVSVTANVTGGNLLTAGIMSAGGNIFAANIIVTGGFYDTGDHLVTSTAANANIVLTPTGTGITQNNGAFSASGNVTGGNILTGGLMSSTGNAVHANVIINGTAAAGSGVLIVSGNIQTSTANATANIGNASNYFNRLFAQATTALYADLAEVYKADAQYSPGTVLVFGGTQEVTMSTESHDVKIAGVVSTHPAHVMNSGLQSEFTVEVGLIGRVPCQVIGPIAAGDRVVSSNRAGVAERLDMSKYQPGVIIGKAVESYSGLDVGTIEVVVGRL